ncbi:LacI family transcriptional regulator [Oceanotoga sp. DSM 15011]|jgi:DNA-binding LacI/PurR family transcriptional regulator|uniref:LacI family transcriptional regulator n=1 Tax=Oceanotoga teriensis TaxID=515440 RepID=A0AA45C6J2_9BACT|nr:MULTISPECIES: LacI family DNA-binding transcriptional regulator [Oceanotoga]MDN5343054.1 hypothetical protein [Oceanotoga sp.]MDO7976636.1 LacI family transcriptional regulator [Oceanotoga teriensis]PWJ92131.1 LacI family transcriptional regulator [Oceanotoga teriensis]UYO99353.1 LacI family transcriptional regulator [Oceanotoga sp. DSM 15011]
MKDSKLTIKDISQMTGYSIRTVSRVINNNPNVKESTRNKIEKVLKETGFETNIFAKSLRKKTMNNIMIVIEKQKNTYPGQWYSILFQKIIDKAAEYDYNVFMTEYISEQKNPFNGMHLLKSGFVDGAIIFNIKENDKKVKIFQQAGIPFVTIGETNSKTPFVATDSFSGMYQATNHLIKNGLTDIVLMLGNLQYTLNIKRKKGYIKAFEDNKIKINENNILINIRTFQDTYNYCKNMKKIPHGIIISGDEKAFGALKALNERNINIPDNISIIGYDNIPLSNFSTPALTTVEQPVDEIVEKSFKMLLDLINEKDVDTEILIPVKLIKRDTTR